MFELIGMVAAIGLIGWLVLLGLFALSVVIGEYERVEFAFFAFLVLCVVLWYFKDVNVPMMMWANLGSVLKWTVVWLVAGIIWSFWKWDRFCAKARTQYDSDVAAGYGEATRPPLVPWQKRVPVAMANKRKFINWIILWPQSVFWYIFSDLIHDLIDIILRQLSHVYDAIAQRHFRDLPPSRKPAE